jgi:MFS family permease
MRTVRVVGAMEDETRRDEESAAERANRELIELLNELRVALPGVQVLFAFLLIVPFSDRFDRLDASDRRVYFAAVLATVASTICLMAPTAHHRLRFRSGIKEQLLRVGNVFAIVGLVLLAFAMAAVTYVITDEIYPGSLPRIVTSVLVATFVVVWFVLPMFFRRERTPEPGEPGG